jgi:branched-chain amino acid transport system permease protein
MDMLLHQIISGVAAGSIYASLALALVMIYNSTSHINFAQGEMAMLTTYLASMLIGAGFPIWVAFSCTVAAGFLLGIVIERTVMRLFARAPALTVVIVFVGLLVMLNSLAGWWFTYTVQSFPSPFPTTAPFGSRYITFHEAGVVGITLGMVALLFLFFRFTSLGLAMRAAAQNPQSSRLAGIRVGVMQMLGWGLAAGLGSAAGIMVAPIVFLEPNMMSGVLVYAFAAALLGGINSPVGAVVGGFIIGIVENLAGTYVLGTELKLTAAFLVIVMTLLLRPNGLFGTVAVTRV